MVCEELPKSHAGKFVTDKTELTQILSSSSELNIFFPKV